MGDMISIPMEEYKSLQAAAEELADLRTFDTIMANLALGDDEAVPADYVRRLVGGESALRVWREFRGLTQVRLAQAAAVNRVQIADIESGRKTGSVETLKKLAAALGITIDDLA